MFNNSDEVFNKHLTVYGNDTAQKPDDKHSYTKLTGVKFMKKFSGTVKVKIEQGMKVRVNPKEFEGKRHAGKEFIVAGEPRDLCGTEVVALNNIDGTRFSAAYDLSMLQVTDTATV